MCVMTTKVLLLVKAIRMRRMSGDRQKEYRDEKDDGDVIEFSVHIDSPASDNVHQTV